MSSVLRLVQQKTDERLSANALFIEHGIDPLSRLKGSIENDIEERLQRLGLAVFIFPPTPLSSKPNVRGPEFDRCELVVRVFENPVLNSREVDAWDIAEEIFRALHQFKAAGQDSFGVLSAAPDRPLVDVSPADTAERIFDLVFHFRANLTTTTP